MRGALTAATVAFFLAISIALQWASGAHHLEFGGYPDESAQVVTGLLIRDYLAKGAPSLPIKFAEIYYLHYPKIVFGMWPPLYHTLIAIWTLLSTNRVWILLLQAVMAGLLSVQVYRIAAVRFPRIVALFAGLTCSSTFVLLEAGRVMMPDVTFAVLAAQALLCFVRFLDSGRRSDVLKFGLFAGLSLATKGNAISLAIVPLLSIAFLRRWDLIFDKGVWTSAVIAGAIGLPWQILMAKLQSGTIPYYKLTARVMLANPGSYSALFHARAGTALWILTGVGVLWTIVKIAHVRADSMSAVQLALLLGFIGTHSIVTFGPESRYFAQVLPAAIFLALAAVDDFAKRVTPRAGLAPYAVVLLLATAASTFSLGMPKKESWGMKEAADFLLRQPDVGSAILISSRAFGESTLVAEAAIHDPNRPSYWVIRGTKNLASANWYGLDYKTLFEKPANVREYLNSVPVRYVVLEETPRDTELPHHAQVREVLRQFPQEWKEVGHFPSAQTTNVRQPDIRIYRREGELRAPDRHSVAMPRTLGRVLTLP